MPTRFINQDEQETLQGIGPPTGTPPGGITKYIDLSTGDVYVNTNGVWTGPGLGPNATYTPVGVPLVLALDGVDTQSVYHGSFWPNSPVNLGPCFWEAWVSPGANSLGYWISGGYGGAHAILAGFQPGDGGRNVLTGNIWNGASLVSFNGYDGIAVGEWGHVAVYWDGTTIHVYVDGIRTGHTAFAGPRQAGGSGSVDSGLWIGGSTHLNYVGKIAMVRGYEGCLTTRPPVSGPGGAGTTVAFTPERPFGMGSDPPYPSFLASYLVPNPMIEDLSSGFNGDTHTGAVYNNRGTSNPPFYPGVTIPAFGLDPTSPFNNPGVTSPPGEIIDTPPATPGSAKIFDSFSRKQQTVAWTLTPSLGSTESGSAGPKVWQTSGAGSWGIIRGRAVFLGNPTANQIAFVNNDTADMDVRVDRFQSGGAAGSNPEQTFSLVGRCADNNNQWSLTNTQGSNTFFLFKTVGGGTTNTGSGTPASTTWVTARLTFVGNVITAYVDNGAGGWTQILQVTDAALNTNLGAGIGAKETLVRYDNFTVL